MHRINSRLTSIMVLVALWLLVASGNAPAIAATDVTGEIVSVGIGGIRGQRGLYRAGCWVPIRVRLENRSGKQFEGRLGVEQADIDDDKVTSFSRTFVLDAKAGDEKEVWLYYWPRPDDSLRGVASVAVYPKDSNQPIARIVGPAGSEAFGTGLAVRDPRTGKSSKLVINLGPGELGFGAFTEALGGQEGVRFVSISNRAIDLPDNALGFDGVDVIVWQADHIRGTPTEMPTEFQMRAILDWVKAGGHLIISVSTQWRDLADPSSPMSQALPLKITGLRELQDMNTYRNLLRESMPHTQLFPDHAGPGPDVPGRINQPMPQVVGTLAAGARRTFDRDSAEAPFAVTGAYGHGAVTLVTVDLANKQFANHMTDLTWLHLWQQLMGVSGQIISNDIYAKLKPDIKERIQSGAYDLQYEDQIAQNVDVTEVTFVRLVLALLFLAIYWVAAGPGGHFVLRYYKRTHWSWWIFGGSVVVAACIAGLFVFFLRLTNYDLRHRTFVMGEVNKLDSHVLGYYGVFAPQTGPVRLAQPEAKNGGSLNYLVPFTEPRLEKGLPFPDPQSYAIENERTHVVNVPFRATLKKMQGRWSGDVAGIEGTAWLSREGSTLSGGRLQGSLTNRSGYDLDRVLIIAGAENLPLNSWNVYRPKSNSWTVGTTLQLDKDCESLQVNGGRILTLGELLEHTGGANADKGMMGGGFGPMPMGGGPSWDSAIASQGSLELLQALMDARPGGNLISVKSDRVQVLRHFTRNFDRTRALRASGGLVIARAGSAANKRYVPCPVPLTVNDRIVEGKGEITYAWTLPIQTIGAPKKN